MLAAYPDTGTGVNPTGQRIMVVRCCHQPSEPGENQTGERRKGSAITTTDRSFKDIIYMRSLEMNIYNTNKLELIRQLSRLCIVSR